MAVALVASKIQKTQPSKSKPSVFGLQFHRMVNSKI